MFQDLRYAFRGLMKAPGFTVAALLTLIFGIGASAAIFGVADAALFAPLPFHDADRLVALGGVFRNVTSYASVTPADFIDYRTRSISFDSVAAAMPNSGRISLTGSGEPEQIRSLLVTGNFFETLGVAPILGRGLTAEDDQVSKPAVAVLAYSFWQRRFGGDSGIVGRQILLDGLPARVVGVMPSGMDVPAATDIWAPIPFFDNGLKSRAAHFLRPLARLKPGVTLESAQAELDVIAADLARAYPDTNLDWRLRVRSLREEIVGQSRPILQLLAWTVGFVLLLACANVSGLFLTRNSRRRHEIAVRLSLGAPRARIVGLVLAESLLLSVFAAAMATAFAAASSRALATAIPGVPPFLSPGGARIVLFSSVVAVLVGIVVGLLPSLQASRNPDAWLKNASRSTSPATRRTHSALAVSQLALALVLLLGTALLVVSFQNLLWVSPGFDPQNVNTMRISLPAGKYTTPEQVRVFYDALLERIESISGVASASLVDTAPFGGLGNDNWFTIQEYPPADPRAKVTADYRYVDARFFETLRIPILKGRAFTRQEAQTRALITIVNETLAKQFIRGADPIGKHLLTDGRAYEIVGVARDVLHRGLNQPPYQTMYFPARDVPETTLVIRSALESDIGLGALVRQSVRGLDRDVPISSILSMRSLLGASVTQRQTMTTALAGFAVAALILAALGIYGVIALGVAERTREIGVRSALGATSQDVRRLVVGQGLKLTLVGIAIGAPLAVMAASSIGAFLFEVQPYDPLVLFAMIATLLCVALAASYIPAHRATRINPVEALRVE